MTTTSTIHPSSPLDLADQTTFADLGFTTLHHFSRLPEFYDTPRIHLAAEGYTLRFGINWDEAEYDPGDEVVFVAAIITDPAGRTVGHDSLHGIGSDDARTDPYVYSCLAECIRTACGEAGVAPSAAPGE